jgi:hypothetical protein
MDNTVLDMFHGLYGPPDGNRKLQVSACATYASVVREVRSSSVVGVLLLTALA